MITVDDLQGHWVRRWIKAPGVEDHTTRVHWMQVGQAYADIRVPANRPSLTGASALADLPATALADLAGAEGFAGHITLEDAVCTWHRAINWHGTPRALDVGSIRFDDTGCMVETGVHADYTELWGAGTGGDSKVLQVSGDGYAGYVVTRGDAFVLGIGKPDKPNMAPVVEALKAQEIPSDAAQLFDGLHVLGHWSADKAIAQLATNPFAEGRTIAHLTDTALVWTRIGFDGHETPIILQHVCAPHDH